MVQLAYVWPDWVRGMLSIMAFPVCAVIFTEIMWHLFLKKR